MGHTENNLARLSEASTAADDTAALEQTSLEKFQKARPIPPTKRRCTDVLFLILFLAGVGTYCYFGYFAVLDGDPMRLMTGQDYTGTPCGYHLDTATQPIWLLTMNMSKIMEMDLGGIIEEGGMSNWTTILGSISPLITQFLLPVCVRMCPSVSLWSEMEDASWAYEARIGAMSFPALPPTICPYDAEKCVPVPWETTTTLGRFCMPQILHALKAPVEHLNFIPTVALNEAFADIKIAAPAIALAAAAAFLSGLIFLIFLRLLAGVVVWLCIVIAIVLLAVGGGAAMYFSQEESIETEEFRLALYYGSFVIWGLCGILTLVILCLIRNIKQGIAVLKTSSMFVYHTPSVLILPPILFLLLGGHTVIMLLLGAFVLSDSSQVTYGESTTISWTEKTQYLTLATFFMYLWGSAFLVSLHQLVMAGAVVRWYFTPLSEGGRKYSKWAVPSAIWIAFRYHLGSIAFGSFILAVVRLFKWILRFLAYQARAANGNPAGVCNCCPGGVGCAPLNYLYLWILGSLAYLVSCFEKCIQFLNRNAYIQMAISGSNFCSSARSAFSIVVANPGKWMTAIGIGKGLRLLGFLIITGVGSAVGFFVSEALYQGKIESALFPTIVSTLLGCLIAFVFMEVLGMALDSTLHCFITDLDRSKNGVPSDCTPGPLQRYVQSYNNKINYC